MTPEPFSGPRSFNILFTTFCGVFYVESLADAHGVAADSHLLIEAQHPGVRRATIGRAPCGGGAEARATPPGDAQLSRTLGRQDVRCGDTMSHTTTCNGHSVTQPPTGSQTVETWPKRAACLEACAVALG